MDDAAAGKLEDDAQAPFQQRRLTFAMPLHQYRDRLFDELMPSFLEGWPGGAVGFEQRCAQDAVIAQLAARAPHL